RYYYHLNDMASTEALTDSTGSLVERYKFEDFGKTTVLNAHGNVLASSIVNNRHLFTGQEYNSETGGYQSYYRNYDPGTGAFTQRDPIGYGDQTSLYQYVGNNPGSYLDPLGLAPCPPATRTVDEIATYESAFNGFVNSLGFLRSVTRYQEQVKRFQEYAKAQQQIIDDAIKAGNWRKAAQASEGMSKITKAAEGLNASKMGKFVNGLGKLGMGLNVADLGLKSVQLNNAVNDWMAGNIDDCQLGDAQANFVESILAFTPPGAALGAVDFVLTGTTGKGVNARLADAGQGAGDLSTRSLTNIIKGVSEEDAMDEAFYENLTPEMKKKYWETRKRMIHRQRRNQTIPGGDGCPPNGPNPGNQTPPPPPPGQNGRTEVIFDKDPNAIIGPDGAGENKWVSVNDRLPYTILFENAKEATAPVKVAKIFHPIDPKLDINTFQLGGFGFNNLTFTVPANTNAYYQRLDARDSLGVYVDVTAGIDAVAKQAFWIFETIDPVTLLPTTEPLKGFLLTQDSLKNTSGHGFVDFSIKPVSNATTGDTTSPYANIVFGSNDTIPTNRHKNTIDALPPTS
ncbi:MAG: RHS repeat-associated core domain-containing protein, partial [Moraxellaceae bacterium]